MKVKCIDNYGWFALTIDKTYDVIRINNFGDYIIINDNGNKNCYINVIFTSLSEYRNEKIDKLLR